MLGNWQQLDVCVTHLGAIGRELVSQIAVAEKLARLGNAFPGTQVDFVDADRRVQGLTHGPLAEPRRVIPHVPCDVPDHRGRSRPKLRGERVRIRFFQTLAASSRADAVLVLVARTHASYKALPDSRA